MYTHTHTCKLLFNMKHPQWLTGWRRGYLECQDWIGKWFQVNWCAIKGTAPASHSYPIIWVLVLLLVAVVSHTAFSKILHTTKKLMFTLNTRLNDEHVVRTELTHFVKKHHVLDDCADKYADIKACRNFCDVHLEFFESVQQAGGSNHVGGLCLWQLGFTKVRFNIEAQLFFFLSLAF